MKPTFFIIGAGKCGTTSLWAYLNKHPLIEMSRIKEPSFFSMESQFKRGWGWYSSLFTNDDAIKHRGEASNSYSALAAYPDTLDRIAAHVPDAKFIYSVRHPRSRTESDWMEFQKAQSVSFSEFLANETLYRDKNQYDRTLAAYRERFGADRVHVLFYDDLVADPAQAVGSCLNFLGLDSDDALEVGKTHRSSGQFVALPKVIRRLQNNRVYECIASAIPSGFKSKLRGLLGNQKIIARPDWQSADYKKFCAEFEAPTTDFLLSVGRDPELWDWDLP